MKTILVILFLFVMGCAQKGQKDVTMFFYGDSITACSNQPEMNPCYPTLVSIGYNETNYAIGGTALFHPNSLGQTPQYYQIMGTYKEWRAQDTVIFLPGTNDGIYYQADSQNQIDYANGLAAIIQVMKASPVGKVYIGTTLKVIDEPAVTNRFFVNSVGQAYADLNAQAVTNANDAKIKLIDFRNCYNPTWDDTPDGLHPNKNGYRKLYNCFEQLK